MNHRSSHVVGIFLFLGAIGLAQSPASVGQAAASERQTVFVNLAHIDAHDAGVALRQLGFPIEAVALDHNPKRLAMRGAVVDLAEIQKNVLPGLDVPTTTPDQDADNPAVAYIPLGNKPSPSLFQLLETVAGESEFALDQGNRLLVVRGQGAELQEIQNLVRAIDRPADSLSLQFFFIKGLIADGEAERTHTLPKELALVGNTLLENGLTDLALLAPVLVSSRDGQHFQTESLVRTAGAEGAPPVSLTIEGTASLLAATTMVQLDLQAVVMVDKTRAFNSQTAVSMELGSYVILAAAPGAVGDCDAMALAVRVVAPDRK